MRREAGRLSMDEGQRAAQHQQQSFCFRDHLHDLCRLLRPQRRTASANASPVYDSEDPLSSVREGQVIIC
jgi:hypothetical protein